MVPADSKPLLPHRLRPPGVCIPSNLRHGRDDGAVPQPPQATNTRNGPGGQQAVPPVEGLNREPAAFDPVQVFRLTKVGRMIFFGRSVSMVKNMSMVGNS